MLSARIATNVTINNMANRISNLTNSGVLETSKDRVSPDLISMFCTGLPNFPSLTFKVCVPGAISNDVCSPFF